jgi:hypothetical protein
LECRRHKQEFEEQERALLLVFRRSRVGLTIATIALQTLREGCSYLQFEKKLLDLHLASLDIGSLNHSKEFIRLFVKSMRTAVGKKSAITCMKWTSLQEGRGSLRLWQTR